MISSNTFPLRLTVASPYTHTLIYAL